MGYTTEFKGQIKVEPPLSEEEAKFLEAFSKTRHMERGRGPYYVDSAYGHGDNDDVADYNQNGRGQPGLWCHWVATEDRSALEWDGGEKFYDPEEWMRYLIDHFLKPGHIAPLPFLGQHTLNGSILAQGEDIEDRWRLNVIDNIVSREDLA
jgi:hypothetical protein